MERRSKNYTGIMPSNQTKKLFDTEEAYLKATNMASQILSLGAGMVGIPVPFFYLPNVRKF